MLETKKYNYLNTIFNSGKCFFKKYILVSMTSKFLQTIRGFTAKLLLIFLNIGQDQGIILNINKWNLEMPKSSEH